MATITAPDPGNNSQRTGGRGGYNTENTPSAQTTDLRPKQEPILQLPLRRSSTQANYTVSGHDLTRHVKAEAQYAGMTPMERFLREGGSSLQRRAARAAPKGSL